MHTTKYSDTLVFVHAIKHGIITVSKSSHKAARTEDFPINECEVRFMEIGTSAKAYLRIPAHMAEAKGFGSTVTTSQPSEIWTPSKSDGVIEKAARVSQLYSEWAKQRRAEAEAEAKAEAKNQSSTSPAPARRTGSEILKAAADNTTDAKLKRELSALENLDTDGIPSILFTTAGDQFES